MSGWVRVYELEAEAKEYEAELVKKLRAALAEACDIALGTELTREAAERIRTLKEMA